MRYLIPFLLLASCGNKKPPESVEVNDRLPTVAFHEAMRGNLEAISDAHVAVIRGDLDEVKRTSAVLAKAPRVEAFPEPWIAMQMDLMMAAGHASRAENLEQASERVVAITARCATCHSSVSQGPSFYQVDGPDSNASLTERMQNHASGADMMWKGLVAADEGLVKRGAERLAAGVERPDDEAPFPPEILDIEGMLLKDASAAAASDSLDEQRVLLGKILPRCGTCHRAAGVTPTIAFGPTLK
ncbi:MAG: cytochrome c553 [Kiritimatiellia bacterium]|jgi:cytochrome c553